MSRSSSKSVVSRILNTDPRERFNWGYWDGRSDRDRGGKIAPWFGKGTHFDVVYEKGYLYGRFDCNSPRTSDAAWNEYQAREASKAA